MISKGRTANKSYTTYVENEKRKQEEKAKLEEEIQKRLEEKKGNLKKLDRIKKDIKGLEENLRKIEKEKDAKKESSDILMMKASAELKEALKKQNFNAIQVSQVMMERAEKKREEERNLDKEMKKMSKQIEDKSKQMLNRLIEKKKSTASSQHKNDKSSASRKRKEPVIREIIPAKKMKTKDSNQIKKTDTSNSDVMKDSKPTKKTDTSHLNVKKVTKPTKNKKMRKIKKSTKLNNVETCNLLFKKKVIQKLMFYRL